MYMVSWSDVGFVKGRQGLSYSPQQSMYISHIHITINNYYKVTEADQQVKSVKDDVEQTFVFLLRVLD